MSSTQSSDLVIEVARDLVAQLEPQELPLFRAASQQFRQNPEGLLAEAKANDNPIGFGAGEAAALLTPAALAVASSVISYLAGELSKTAADTSASFLVETVRRLFKKSTSATAQNGKQQNNKQLPALTPNQLSQVREIVLKQARQAKLSDPRAKALADATVGMLAISMGV